MSEAKTVKVTAAKLHTHEGETHQPGDVYELDETLVDSLAAQGMAFRTDPPEPPPKKESHPVEPMTTHDLAPHAKKTK